MCTIPVSFIGALHYILWGDVRGDATWAEVLDAVCKLKGRQNVRHDLQDVPTETLVRELEDRMRNYGRSDVERALQQESDIPTGLDIHATRARIEGTDRATAKARNMANMPINPEQTHVVGKSDTLLSDQLVNRAGPGIDALKRAVEERHVVGKSGAKSSGWKLPYHLIPWDVFADRLSRRYQVGMEHGYEEDNWRKGLTDRDYVLDRANHTLDHLHRAVEDLRLGNFKPTDDDLAAAIWGCIFLMAAQRAILEGPERFLGRNRPIGAESNR